MILELDIGNSRVKWRVTESSHGVSSGCYSHDAFLDEGIEALSTMQAITRLRVASVADSLKPAVDELAEKLSVRAEYAMTAAECAGVSNSYVNPKTMGVDRWLAMLAAFAHSRSTSPPSRVCVIDCGTSLTIDYLAPSGRHEGGLILPGRRLLLDSLQRKTEKVLFDPSSNGGQLSLGQSTEDAVLNGAIHMLVGAIHESFGAEPQHPDCQFYLCGGDAEWLQPALRLKALLVPDLVLDGLRLSLP